MRSSFSLLYSIFTYLSVFNYPSNVTNFFLSIDREILIRRVWSQMIERWSYFQTHGGRLKVFTFGFASKYHMHCTCRTHTESIKTPQNNTSPHYLKFKQANLHSLDVYMIQIFECPAVEIQMYPQQLSNLLQFPNSINSFLYWIEDTHWSKKAEAKRLNAECNRILFIVFLSFCMRNGQTTVSSTSTSPLDLFGKDCQSCLNKTTLIFKYLQSSTGIET